MCTSDRTTKNQDSVSITHDSPLRAHFCEEYRKQAEEYDQEFSKYDEDLNTTLIFVGLPFLSLAPKH
jgi:hypothetical protein